MSRSIIKQVFKVALSLSILLAGGSANASIFLLGTDTVELHGDASFINPLVNQLGSSNPAKSVLFLTSGANSTNYTGPVSLVFQRYSFLDTATLSDYSGIYIDSPGGCCSDPGPSLNPADNIKVADYVTAGGNLAVGDYQGSTFFDAALGFTGSTGVRRGSLASGADCLDPAVSTASGIAFGFAASYSEGCFVHRRPAL